MSFEVEGRDIIGIPVGGAALTPEAAAIEKAAREEADKEAAEFLAEQRKKREAVDFAERRQAQTRAAQLLKDECVEIIMRVNPNFDETDAKILFERELKEKIAVERFMRAFFAEVHPKTSFQM